MDIRDFSAIRISLASPEEIRSWSYGEVTKPETINYRRLRPEKDGLFCEAIFGPTKDWQCYCGKYKKIRYRGIKCDKCGVEITRSSVRRERMGHIELACPVAHIWYTRRVPSYMSLLLDISRRNLDRVLYYAQYIITKIDEDARNRSLRRLRDEAVREEGRLRNATRERIGEIETHLGQEVEKLRSETATANEDLEEQLAAETDKVMSEAAQIQEQLNQEMGVTLSKPIFFSPSQEIIAQIGETISREHLSRLTQLVQAEIEALESSFRQKQQDNQALLQTREDSLRQEASEEIEQLAEQSAADVAAIQARIEPQSAELKEFAVGQFLNEFQYRALEEEWGGIFQAGMGAEAIYEILKDMDLDALSREFRAEIEKTRSKQKRKKATKRLQVVEALRKSENRPEWMILTALPVIPPDLRPMVQLDGGRFATSDLNDLYRRVINRNNRLRRLMELGAPDVIVRNERRMLQEAVDSLIDNSRRGKAVSLRGKRQLTSLSDMLKGKQGRFRRNLLGKRVDYSGRSVIVTGPNLRLHQCGLPKKMALELFKPFVINRLVEYNYAHNVKGAKRLIDRMGPEVWEALEEVIEGRTVLLNRAPTLHRLGIQAFEPVLIEGDAIQIHPLVCTAFAADFDGDMMAVHVPLSKAAQEEARNLMLSRKNLLLPANGEPVVAPSKDMVLGCYYLTLERDGMRGEGKTFADLDEVALAYDLGKVDLHAKIELYTSTGDSHEGELIETTVGRALFNQILPQELRFVDCVLDRGKLKDLVAECYSRLGLEATADLVDEIKNIGFRYATRSGTTIAIEDVTIPQEKEQILAQASQMVEEVEDQYRQGVMTDREWHDKVVEIWGTATEEITEAVAKALDPAGSIHIIAASGAAKGGFQPVRQMAGMRGLMTDPAGRVITLPIRSNFREGLTSFEYFISTHGARKGLADTALRTAEAGYLTRRLVDVSQDVIINDLDCGTRGGIWIRDQGKEPGVGESFGERILGRFAARPVVDPKTGEVIVDTGQMIGEKELETIQAASLKEVYARSPLACQLQHGICAACYGRDLARRELVKVGEAVGVIAAQSIGEPGTQLTLRTFHTGGVAGDIDITQGLPRAQELFEARTPKAEAVIADLDGVVEIVEERDRSRLRIVENKAQRDQYIIPPNYEILVEDGQEVGDGTVLAKGEEQEIVATFGGRLHLDDHLATIHYEKQEAQEYEIALTARLLVKQGQQVRAGQQLTDGVQNPHQILQILGREAVQEYLLEEIQKVYRSQGVNINDKHIEIILRKMLSKVKVKDPGDTDLLLEQLVDRLQFAEINQEVMAEEGRPAVAEQVLLGITKVALKTESFLSAASFQHTISVLAEAAIEGKVDHLHGLKENVIVGKLIPAGTGFRTEEQIGEEIEQQPEEAVEEPTPMPMA